MRYLLLGYDGTDEGALDRRLAAREEHLENLEKLVKSGNILYAVAMINAEGNMYGSAVVYDYPDRCSLDKALQDEPYIKQNVWQKIEVTQCGVPAVLLAKE